MTEHASTAIKDPYAFLRDEMKKEAHSLTFLAMKRAADEIDLLRVAVRELVCDVDNPWPSDTDIGQAVDRALNDGRNRDAE